MITSAFLTVDVLSPCFVNPATAIAPWSCRVSLLVRRGPFLIRIVSGTSYRKSRYASASSSESELMAFPRTWIAHAMSLVTSRSYSATVAFDFLSRSQVCIAS